jgi:hypothetical protein
MGKSIGQLLGKVEASEFYEYPDKKLIIKIKVSLNVFQPIVSLNVFQPIASGVLQVRHGWTC